ncbi:transposase [Bradyrhizobium sp. 4]|nr:transposase [Bradyrhizobium sp. 4]
MPVSTLADQVDAGVWAAMPLYPSDRDPSLSAEWLHGDDTKVPILAPARTVTQRIWAYVRNDWTFGGRVPPAAVYYASRDRRS